MAARTASDSAVYTAAVCAAAMMAHHVMGKAVRDTLFLSSFNVTTLPLMVIGASAFSIAVVLLTSRALTRFTPARVVPAAFAASAIFYLSVWGSLRHTPRMAAVLIYLEVVGFGSVLASGFWSIVNERFDPRAAKRNIGRIAGGGTLGGLLGGLLAERLATAYAATALLPILAFLHLVCAALIRGLQPGGGLPAASPVPGEPHSASEPEQPASVFRILGEAPYLRTLAAVVLMGTASAAIIDYVFKAQAVTFFSDRESLLGFFALFYSGVSLLTFLVQTGLSRVALEKLGLAKTVGTLPFAVAAGGLGALVAPGVASAGLARALEAIFRGSLFRSGYELFYTPIPLREKRAAKSIVDVGFDRLGEALGSGLVRLLLMFGPLIAHHAILTAAILVALLGLWTATRLHKAYIGILEKSLLQQGQQLELAEFGGSVASSALLQELSALNPGIGIPAGGPRAQRASHSSPKSQLVTKSVDEFPARSLPKPELPARLDPLVQRLQDLRSGEPSRVLKALRQEGPLNAILVPQTIELLAWDHVSTEAIRSLRRVAPAHTGQLLDILLNPEQEFSVRRRIPRVLSSCPSQKAVDGLLAGLHDRRFEVRFQCGRALAAILAAEPGIRIPSNAVHEAVLREVAVGRPVWVSQRLLDQGEERESSPIVDDFLRDRTNRSLEHVFNLLSLLLPKEPLKVAFHGLHTDDLHLRGTALEYLESVLTPEIREGLWPFLEDNRPTERPQRPREQLLEELMRSNQSILLNLAEIREKTQASGPKS